jgi:hypothetical protein
LGLLPGTSELSESCNLSETGANAIPVLENFGLILISLLQGLVWDPITAFPWMNIAPVVMLSLFFYLR